MRVTIHHRSPGRARLASWAAAVLLAGAAIVPARAAAGPAAGDSAGSPAAPGWPLRLGTRYLTSDFMEPREGRFHAGIDLKTDERTGLPAVAVEDGWIAALRAAPEGYGRSLLLRGVSGRLYLYAHLWRFADRFRPLVEAAQRREGRYRVEVELPPDSLRVVRGEVLALTGESGTVGPHLHFEVRSVGGEVVNPLRAGFAVRDTFPPRIVRLRAMPAAAEGRVAGSPLARSIAAQPGLAGELPALRISGPVAFAAEIREQADVKGHALAAYALTVRCDSVEVFAARNDSFPLAANTSRRLEWLECGDVRAQWLLRRPQDRLPGRAGGLWSVGDGGLAPGDHRIELEVLDAAGNRAAVSWTVTALPRGETPLIGEAEAAGWQSDPVGIVLVADAAGPRVRLAPFVELVRDEQGWIALDSLRPEEPSGADQPAAPWRRLVLEPGPDVPLLAPAAICVAADSVGGVEARQIAARTGLATLGPAARVAVADWPAAGPVPIPWPATLTAATGRRDVALYREGEPGAWDWAGALRQPAAPGSAGSLPVTRPGRYALLRDTRPPAIGAAPAGGIVRRQSPRRIAGVTLPRWQVLDVAVADSGSGIDAASVAVTLDGAPLIAEPDLIHGRVRIELPDRLPAGRHLITLCLADRAGNLARRKLSLVCRAAD